MVERIQPLSPGNFLYNMVKISVNTSNALTPSCLRPPFGAQHESTGFCGWVSSTRKGPIHIPNPKAASQKAWRRASYQKWPKKMPRTLTLPLSLPRPSRPHDHAECVRL